MYGDLFMNISDSVRSYWVDFRKAVGFSVDSWRKRVGVVLLSVLSFLFFVGLTFPQYAFDLVISGPQYWYDAFASLLWLMRESSGLLGVSLVVLYAIATGVLSVVVLGSIKYRSNGSGGFLSVLPAVLFSGCASCGAGLLGVIGAFGLASVFPFDGNLIRVMGILLVIGVLSWVGDPRECAV
jgi:hypothetical protein